MRAARAAALLLGLAGCARMGDPPGGPPDVIAPELTSVFPDTIVVSADWNADVEFRFNETVSEGGSPNFGLGTGDLEKLVLLSPSDEVPVVRWRRSRITVHPREGWRPDRVYRIELLGGIADLRNNRTRSGRVLTFTTGGEVPTTVLQGTVVDWSTARPVPRALIEAILLPDSLAYRTETDSIGEFQFGPLPRGEYLVRGVLDQNRNRRSDPRESFDTVRVAAGQDSVGELWAFRHDSVGPRVQSASLRDSLGILVQLSQPVNPYQTLAPDSAIVTRVSDSTRVAVVAVVRPSSYDSLFAARRDTTPARPDTVVAPPPPPRPPPADRLAIRTSRPTLIDRVVLRLATPLTPGERYTVDLAGIENPNGAAGRGRAVLALPARPDTTAAQPDSAVRQPPDSLHSLRRR